MTVKTTAVEKAQAKLQRLEELTPDQRSALLKAAGIGDAGQARALGAAFRMLEKAVSADDELRVGKGKLGRMVKRPNWPVRISASRTLLEWLAPVVKRSVNAGPSGRTVVNVVTAPYAHGVSDGLQQARAVVLDVESKVLDAHDEDEMSDTARH
jgi:hypothetical protein